MMNRLIVTFFMLIFAAGAVEITAVRTESVPQIDGKLDETIWQKAPPVTRFFGNKDGTPAKVRTEARFLYDSNALYVGIKAFLPPGAQYRINDKNLYAGECIELMLDPGATRNVYFHFITNPNGAKYDAMRDQGGFVGNPKWDAVWKTAAQKTPEFWSCEFKIPYSSLDFPSASGNVWTVNVARGARGLTPDGAQEDSSLAADGAYHIAGKFPELKGFDVDFQRYAWNVGKPEVTTSQNAGKIGVEASVNVCTLNKLPCKAKVSVSFFAPDGTAQSRSVNGEFAPGKTEKFKFTGFRFNTPGGYRCEVLVSDLVTKRALNRREYSIPVVFNPLSIVLVDPHYKNAIFATMKLDKVKYRLQLALLVAELKGKKIVTGIRTPDGKTVTEVSVDADNREFTFPVASLPDGKLEIFARLTGPDGGTTVEAAHPLRKLAYLKGEVWLAKNDQTFMVDGKPFFAIMQWSAREDFLPGVNVFLDWVPYRGTKFVSPALSHDRYFNQLKKNTSISSADEARIRKRVTEEMKKPELFAYCFCDEPEVFGDTVEALNAIYKIVEDVDPYHPLLLSNDTIYGVIDYADAGDINGLHPYPAPDRKKKFNDFAKVLNYLEAFQAFFRTRPHKQALTWLAQGFDYTNFAAVNTRIPRYIELRNQHLLSFIMGGRGVELYNSLNSHYPEIGIGLAEHVKEINAYAPVLMEPAAIPELKLSLSGFRWTARRHNGELWLFIANVTHEENRELAVTLPELGNRKLKVMAENRTVQSHDGILRDTFGNFDIHVYTTDLSAPDLRSCADIEAEIDRINAARRKPGNLAFQMFEYETVRVNASSNLAFNVRADNALWHIADGVIEPPDFKHYRREQVVWTDKTPNVFPDWIELEFKQPVTMSRVIVYPVGDSLKDYQIQVWEKDAWRTVADVRNASGPAQEQRFAAVQSRKVRIFITATRGPNAMISEVEVYEK